MNPPKHLLALAISITLCLLAGGLGAIATTPQIDGWYQTIEKPPWNPPSYVFGPVWTTLYVLMGVAAWLVWKRDGLKVARPPLTLFGIQLIFNVAWSWIFFGLHQPGWAVADIAVLWLTIAATVIAFFRTSLLAGLLMLPYWAWVTFASVLNFSIWQLNR